MGQTNMEINITLNEQQSNFLKEVLSTTQDSDWFDNTSATIAKQIITKLNEA